jgi:O-glycosyl hydrolase
VKSYIGAVIALAAVFSLISGEALGEGEVIGWGNNTHWQAGVPLGCTLFTLVSGGYYHSLGLQQSGTILASGLNDYGQCEVPAPNADFNAIAAGGRHSLGLKLDGSIVAWGHNGYGQCDVPVPNTDFLAIAAGYSHSLGLKADGSIVAWGRNDYGQCDVPVPNSGFIAVAAGSYHSLGLKWNGQIVAWGYNAYGQCNVPTPNSGFKAVEGGAYHSLGLKQDGSVVAWGNNGLGQCTVPAPNSDFKAISAGAYHSIGLKNNGTIVAWGYNASGQCTVPAPNSNFKAISAGGEHSLALRTLSLAVYGGNVDYNAVYQQIEGFGGAGAYDVWQLSVHEKREAIYDLIFRDLGLEFYRIFNSYKYGNGGPFGWESIGSNKEIVEAAKTRNPSLKILMSAWSPSADLKDNDAVQGNGGNWWDPGFHPATLDSNASGIRYNDYAKWWADSIEAHESNNIKVDYISIQNEPDFDYIWETCFFTPVESYYNGTIAGYNLAFEAVYQELHNRFGDQMPKMLAPESANLTDFGGYVDNLIDESHVYAFATHLYDVAYDNPDSGITAMTNLHNNYGYKPVYQTEYSSSDSTEDIQAAVYTAWHIHNAMTYLKANIYYYWYLWFMSGDGGAIHLPDEVNYIVNPTYYAIKHYSKFTDAGWYVVDSSVVSGDIRITAFKNPEKTKLTIVIINKSNNTEGVLLDLTDFVPLNSEVYRTSQTEQWRYLGIFNPSQQLICPGKSITTISMTRKITDCSVALDTGHRLSADLGGAGDCYVNFADFVVLAGHWLDNNCAASGNCDGADFEPADGAVDIYDMGDFAAQWLTCNDPENPDCTPNW